MQKYLPKELNRLYIRSRIRSFLPFLIFTGFFIVVGLIIFFTTPGLLINNICSYILIILFIFQIRIFWIIISGLKQYLYKYLKFSDLDVELFAIEYCSKSFKEFEKIKVYKNYIFIENPFQVIRRKDVISFSKDDEIDGTVTYFKIKPKLVDTASWDPDDCFYFESKDLRDRCFDYLVNGN